MNRRGFDFTALLFVFVLLITCTPRLMAQRMVDVQAGVGTLQAAIDADSTNRKANPNTVYRVHRGSADSIYIFTKTLSAVTSPATTIRIEAVGSGPLPTFKWATLSDGSAISPLISVKMNLSVKGIFLDGINTLGSVADRMVRIQSNGMTLVFDSCQINRSAQSFIRVDNGSARIFLKNCRVSNIFSDFSNARGVDNRGVTIDTLSMVGCTFYRLGQRAYRDGGGVLTYGYFNHNTFVDIGDAALSLGSAKNITFTNNLVYNCGFLGSGKSSGIGRIIGLTPVTSGQSAYVTNNIFYADSVALLAAYKTSSDTVVFNQWFSDTLNAFVAAAGFTNTNISSPVTFTLPPGNTPNAVKIDSIVRWYWRNPNTNSGNAAMLEVDSLRLVNLAYNTSAPAYTFSTDRRPAGATEWFGLGDPPAQITSNGTGGGLWSSSTTWAGGIVPTGIEKITILAGDAIIYDKPVTITGTLVKQSALADSIATGGRITFASGGTYQHDVDGGTIPTATWSAGSTYLLTGMTANKPANGAQNYYNVTINLGSGYTAAKDLGWVNNTLGGTLRLINTNSQQVRLSSPSAPHGPAPGTITINGDFLVDSSICSVGLNGSSTVDTLSLTINGNIVSKGTVSMGGSGLNATWYVKGNVSFLGGAFTGHSAHTDSLVYIGTTRQTFYSTLPNMNNVFTRVRTGAILDMDTVKIGTHSRQAFVVEPGATVITADPQGWVGNLNNSALKDLSTLASYTYDGIVLQSDTLLPATVKNLTINNTAGFALSKPTTVTGVLTLQAGQLDNSVNAVTIAPGGNIVRMKGTVKVPIPGWPVTGIGFEDPSIPKIFALSQNYPNPFNPSTTIAYDLPTSGSVKIVIYDVFGREVGLLVNASRNAGTYRTSFNGTRYASGVYFYRLIVDGNVIASKKMTLIK